MPTFWNETQNALINEIISSTIEETLDVFKDYPRVADYLLSVLQRINEGYDNTLIDNSRNEQLRPIFKELVVIKNIKGWIGLNSYSTYLNQFLGACDFCYRDCLSSYIATLKKVQIHYYITKEQDAELKNRIADNLQTARNTLNISSVPPDEALELLQKIVQSAPSLSLSNQTYIPTPFN